MQNLFCKKITCLKTVTIFWGNAGGRVAQRLFHQVLHSTLVNKKLFSTCISVYQNVHLFIFRHFVGKSWCKS